MQKVYFLMNLIQRSIGNTVQKQFACGPILLKHYHGKCILFSKIKHFKNSVFSVCETQFLINFSKQPGPFAICIVDFFQHAFSFQSTGNAH